VERNHLCCESFFDLLFFSFQIDCCIIISMLSLFCFSGSEPVYDRYEQGTIVDRIDYNITNVAASVEQGVKELVKVRMF